MRPRLPTWSRSALSGLAYGCSPDCCTMAMSIRSVYNDDDHGHNNNGKSAHGDDSMSAATATKSQRIMKR